MRNWFEYMRLNATSPELTSTQGSDARSLARQLEHDLRIGCGDNSCHFKRTTGMSTNGGCRCRETLQDAIEAFARRVLADERAPYV